MASFGGLLYSVGQALLSVSVKRMLTGAGLGLATYSGVTSLLNKLIADANSMLASGDGKILSLIGLTGIDTALSLILSACVVRATIHSSAVFVTKQ